MAENTAHPLPSPVVARAPEDSLRPPERAQFRRMDESSRAEWMLIGRATVELQPEVPERVLAMLRSLEGMYAGFGVDQLHHALQTASMAKRANASDEMVLVALCHDVGKAISIQNHAAIAAEMLKPYVSDDAYHVLRTHQDFQGRHYYEHFGMSANLRAQYAHEPWFALAEQFTDEWDQAAFDPDYPVLPLAEFEPLVREKLGRFTFGAKK
ncbi:MAG: HD domain-containing protein [Myxococcales bacterium]